MPRHLLKDYQEEALRVLREYADAVRDGFVRGSPRPERDAFELLTEGRMYFAPPGFEGTPYVCLRIPTGGGKTLMAAHALGEIGRHLLATDAPLCLWICPSTTIRDQTHRGLRTRGHGLRMALEEAVGSDVEVLTLEQALMTNAWTRASAPTVIVTTIQSYRISDDRGTEIEANRRIYRDDGYLQSAFEDLPEWAKRSLSRNEAGLINLSLANAIRLRAPIVVMDEAHNARTPTSFESLARFGPSFVLELTATPIQEHDPARAVYASNVLHAASALELKNEGMIKLPVDLESRSIWTDVLGATKQRRDELEAMADRWHEESGYPPIRPIALIQAQPNRQGQESHTPEVVKKLLIERLNIHEREVKICTGALDEIGDQDIMLPDSEVRYVITVDKLREGWDCPFAYVLGSIGRAATATAVEQLLGRVLRMPYAKPTEHPALDRAYAFVLSEDVMATAIQLRDKLVETCGFDEHSARDALRVSARNTQAGLPFGRIPMSQPPATEALPDTLRPRVEYDRSERVLIVQGTIDRHEANALREAAGTEEDRQAVQDYWERERPLGTAIKPITDYAPPFLIPQMVLVEGERRSLFDPIELDTFDWNLDACAQAIDADAFPDALRVGSAATIDLAGRGGLVTESAGDVRLRQLELIGEGDDWSEVELVRWLDRELHRGDLLLGLPHRLSQPWLARVLSSLVGERNLSLPSVVRRRHELSTIVRDRVVDHGRKQLRAAMLALIGEGPSGRLETSPAVVFELAETAYAPSSRYDGGHRFRKHAFEIIRHLNREEVNCAVKIDEHPNVKRWVVNAAHPSQGGFGLPLSPGNFYPDFVVELNDGTVALVEYKGKHISEAKKERHKNAVGDLWADRSNGACRFAWIEKGDWAALNRKLSDQPQAGS